jgi:hypothetical protein
MSVLPNVFGHGVITSGLGPVPKRKASAAHDGPLRFASKFRAEKLALNPI